MQRHAAHAQLVRRLDGDHLVAQLRQPRGIGPGSSADVEHPSWGGRQQMKNDLVLVVEAKRFVSFDELVCLLRVALRTADHNASPPKV